MSDETNAARFTGGDDAADDMLLSELRALAARHDPIPPEALAAARSAIAWRTLDAELAELTAESELVGVRGGDGPELLTFDAPGLTVEIEVAALNGRRRLLGQLVPPVPGRVEVRHAGLTVTVEADAAGRFLADDVVAGPVSLRCAAGSHLVETDWFLA
ncbi:MAG: hypothetical protein ACR2KK_20645 [Acidimicrobiales bacterium]